MAVAELLTGPFSILGSYVLPFLAVLTLIVFVHEYGHYRVARWCGVNVEAFSIGFGREIFGWNDRHGTRWKVCWLPLGGYVKFAGDANAASMPDSTANRIVKPGDFQTKPVLQRAAVVVAGPAANYILAIAIFALSAMLIGVPASIPKVAAVKAGSAAEAAGILPGDVIIEVDGVATRSFEDVQRLVTPRAGDRLPIILDRNGQKVTTTVTPTETELKAGSRTVKVGLIGVERAPDPVRLYDRKGPVEALGMALDDTWYLTSQSLYYIGRMITGHEKTDQLAGPLGIAEMTGQAASLGFYELMRMAAILSVSIGLLNLFPIPMLDGGHLLFYAVEAVRGKPLGQAAQELGFKVGFALVLTLMMFATWNDLVRFITT
ncbi:MAG: RIP metalloprotease RseP [Hyphomicrobiales bacterium]